MYKEFIISFIIIVFVIILNIYTENYTKESVSLITDNLEKLKTSINEENNVENNEEIKKQIDFIIEEWDNRNDILAYYIEHNELEKVKTEMVSLKANIEEGEPEKGIMDLNKCIFILDHIKEKTALQIKNIF